MKTLIGNKIKMTTIALILILSMTSSLMLLPDTSAHTPPLTVPTYAYLSIAPNPVGLGQTAFVNFWLNLPPPTAAGAYGDRWHGLKVTVTKPDGTKQTLGPYNSDAVGGWYAQYAPSAIGTYTFVFEFPGQTITGENPNPITGTATATAINDTYTASVSAPVTLTVVNEQVTYEPDNPLPTGYWQRPVQSVNTPWWEISGNWLGLAASTFAATGQYNASGNFNPYTKAPNTAHILWTRPEAFGGLIGGEFGGSQQSNYYSTSQYEPKFAPIIMNGILYYTMYPGATTYPAGWVAVDIRTGQTLWTKQTNDILRCGQTFNYISPNQYGGLAYLWSIPNSATGYAYSGALYYSLWDAMTGNFVLNITNGLPVTMVEADDGSLIGYFVNSTDRTLNKWNSTECIAYPNGHIAENWQWRPGNTGQNINFSRGIMWKVPLPTTIPGGGAITPNLGISKIAGDVILMLSTPMTGAVSTFFQPGYQTEAAFNANTGALMWGPLNRTETAWTRIYMGPAAYGVFTEYVGETMTWTGYSLATGNKIWGPVDSPHNAWSYYGCQMIPAYGNLYAWDFGGYVNCFDMQTGALEWTYNTGSSGYETPYGVWPLWTFTAGTIADGKIYVPEGHMYSPPLFHGAKQLAIDTSTGKLVWSIQSFDVTSGPAIADGYMMTLNAYDNQIYCYGKGQTATTVVSAPENAIAMGSKVLIKGTITDQSPGITALGIPAKGTPAVSDASQTAWMEYMYMQRPMPTNASGVPVTITAYDANGNSHDVATVTSDISGTYAVSWTPPVEGLYRVVAKFAGSEAYFGSTATTYFVIGAAAASPAPTGVPPTQAPPISTSTPVQTATPTPSPVPQPGEVSNTMIYVAAAAVVIIVVIAVTALVLKRRK